MHFLPNENNFHLVDSFDVNYLANQLKEAGVGYFVLTLGQNSGYFNAPNPTYDAIAGYEAGQKTSTRDLPMEMAQALKERGISMMLYLPSQTPNRDLQSVVNFGFPHDEINTDRQITPQGAANWAKVIAWWSAHYGTLVRGWWFDGSYSWCQFHDSIAKAYADAAKSGNPTSIVAFNPGVRPECQRNAATEDYTAGEANDFLSMQAHGRYTDNLQTHVLTYLGSNWGARDCRIPFEQIEPWLTAFTDSGGVVTFDVGANYNLQEGPIGSLSSSQLEQLKQITHSVRRSTSPEQ